MLVALPIMLDTLRRLLFSDSRPIDWAMLVIELLVLFLIAYEVGHGVLRTRKLGRRVKAVLELVSEGVQLQQAVPKGSVTAESVNPWQESVLSWTQRTTQRLARYSAQASYSFAHITSRPAADYAGVAGEVQNVYGCLVWRMDILRRMMEKPDAYF